MPLAGFPDMEILASPFSDMLFVIEQCYSDVKRYNYCWSRYTPNVNSPTFVTGLWKTDQFVTLGLFHFIGAANGYTCTQPIHSAITRLG